MILHFSHIGLTDGRTFMIPLKVATTAGLWLPLQAAATWPRTHAARSRTPRARPRTVAKPVRPAGSVKRDSSRVASPSSDGALRPRLRPVPVVRRQAAGLGPAPAPARRGD